MGAAAQLVGQFSLSVQSCWNEFWHEGCDSTSKAKTSWKKKQEEILEQKQRCTHHLWDSVAEHIYENRDNCRFVAIHPHTITEDNDPNPQVLNSLLNSPHGKILLKLFSPPMLLVHVLVRLKWSSVACYFTAVHPVTQLTPCLLLRYSWHALGSTVHIRTGPRLSLEDGKCLLHKTE